MTVNILTPLHQFQAGDDLWIFPQLEKSLILKKMDWYLNFQLHNSNFQNQQPTYICSHKKLPTKAIVSVPFSGDIKAWSINIYKVWQNLNCPSFRIFLPDNIKNAHALEIFANKPINVVLG